MFSLSINQVAKIINNSDKIFCIAALKELMHRKGLNLRFMWLVLTKVQLQFGRELIMIAILVRVMRKVINEEVKIKSRILKVQSNQLDQEYFQGN